MADYTVEDLQAIVTAPMMTGLAVALIDLGLVSTAIEAAAMTKEMAGAAQKYPANRIIQAAFSQETLKSGQVKLDKPEIKPEEVQSGAVIDRAIAAINTALERLADKATEEEITEYKQFIYNCGQVVAEAAGSGLFGSGNKVSDKEANALARLKETLELP